MLISMTVQNFAIIDNISIDFSGGMTVLTGETGAGKSLIIDAIALLFGRRASTDLIRFGETKAIIEGVFSEMPLSVKALLDDLVDSEDYLVIRREIHANGKSLCKINNAVVTLSQLSSVADELGDIHTQYDTQGLFNPKNYIDFIDDCEVKALVEEYKHYLAAYREANAKYKNLSEKSLSDRQNLELLNFQKTELEKADISLEEEEELKSRNAYLVNFEEINRNIKAIIDIYQTNNTLRAIYESINYLEKLSPYNEKYSHYKARLEEYYYGLEDLVEDINREFKVFEYDETELDRINERLGLYSDLKRKYKMSTEEIVFLYQKISEQIDGIVNYDFHLTELKKQVNQAYQKTHTEAQVIREKRICLGKQMENEIKSGLADLQLKNIDFQITFNPLDNIQFYVNGIDEIDFMISFNPGEPLRPLSKVASGGELSRFMLALKALVFGKINLQIIVFDEIDIGVSGAIAYSIASKIKQISKKAQVLCVTHLPQVAAAADHHIAISKQIFAERTVTMVTTLEDEDRIIEIGKMISNGEATPASKTMAAELLKGRKIK
ncbi:MAG: DNA repair protein RecN [Bacilli bacterium]|nr:DNA repair protein RecN [Bacilli bacterium]